MHVPPQVETIWLGERKLSVRTSVLEEKATACNMLCCYADELKEGFYPYVEQARAAAPVLAPPARHSPSIWGVWRMRPLPHEPAASAFEHGGALKHPAWTAHARRPPGGMAAAWCLHILMRQWGFMGCLQNAYHFWQYA